MIENRMVVERPERSWGRVNLTPPKQDDPICNCGCGRTIQVVELRTHEDEPVYEENCYLRIAFKEGWLRKVAV